MYGRGPLLCRGQMHAVASVTMSATRLQQPRAQLTAVSTRRLAAPSLPKCAILRPLGSSSVRPARRVSAYAQKVKRERAAPPGFGKYETLVVLKPTLTEEERDQELARFESFLHSVSCHQADVLPSVCIASSALSVAGTSPQRAGKPCCTKKSEIYGVLEYVVLRTACCRHTVATAGNA